MSDKLTYLQKRIELCKDEISDGLEKDDGCQTHLANQGGPKIDSGSGTWELWGGTVLEKIRWQSICSLCFDLTFCWVGMS